MKKGTEVTLCGNHIWCPVIKYNGKEVLIKDDYGGMVKLSPAEWNLLIENIDKKILSNIKDAKRK